MMASGNIRPIQSLVEALNPLMTSGVIYKNMLFMEVKMFVCNNPQHAEREVNEWLSQHQVRVCYVTQSQSERGGKFIFVISVFYKKPGSNIERVMEREQLVVDRGQ